MSQMHPLNRLDANLIPFTGRQISSSLIWCADNTENTNSLIKECSYVVDPFSTALAKTFYAERYGGSGIQRNGGGARCGFDGNYQVKGIGANSLVGKGTDERHSNGALGATHAIYEALWGEVLAQILPYGAVRAKAVLLTNLYTHKVFDRSHGKSRRALLVREPVIRPAHFERAPYFQAKNEFAEQLIHDARRVSSVIHFLPENLPMPQEGFSDKAFHNQQVYCIEGLCELARREAWQMAYCRTRFLRLTTSPSNITMDGRLMDFNGLNCLFPGNFPNDFGYQLRCSELIKEPMVLMQGLSDLCLYIGKYLFSRDFIPEARMKVEAVFQKTFDEAYYYCYLEQLGIPVELLPQDGIPYILKQLVNSIVVLVNKRINLLTSTEDTRFEDSPLQILVIELIRQARSKTFSFENDTGNDIHFMEAKMCFSKAINWLSKISVDRQLNLTYILTQMEINARKRLQSRKWLAKSSLSENIINILDEYNDNPHHMLEAFSGLGNKMQSFSKEALGHIKPVKIIM